MNPIIQAVLDKYFWFEKTSFILTFIVVVLIFSMLAIALWRSNREVERLQSELRTRPFIIATNPEPVKRRIDELFDGFEASLDDETKKW